ncbi:MAG: class I SAM-dependent methyltransferase [Bacteroidia bacterium]|nr:class I SAM-dependent methyltransferase [Bacteroidia bacterium]
MIKKIITKRIIGSLKVLTGFAKAVNVAKKTPYVCNVCGKSNVSFDPLPIHYFHYADKYQFIHNIFYSETINLINYLCNECEASDRDRLTALYFSKIYDNTEKKLLDIAPYAPLSNFFKKHKNLKIRTADYYADGVDDKVDITNMHIYNNETYDIIICMHVLEHVENELAGMSELYRVMKKGGWGVIMVPINSQLEKNYVNPSAESEEERWHHYGHPDHKRLNSRQDFVKSLKSVGFKVLELDKDYFGIENFEKHAIHERSVLYIVQK